MLSVQDLRVTFHDKGAVSEAVSGISFDMAPGEILGIVGESGSGKTVTALTIAGLLRQRRDVSVTGRILFFGHDLLAMSARRLQKLQGKEIAVVFQEPQTSLNPLMRVGKQIEEALKIHTDNGRRARKALTLDAMEAVELEEPDKLYKRYPHQISGGQRQRAMLAAAMILTPQLLICDEPTTALDVTVQAQILALLKKRGQELGVGILFISHDLQVVRHLCNRAIVMREGQIVEQGDVETLFTAPQADYTKKLLQSIPKRGEKSW